LKKEREMKKQIRLRLTVFVLIMSLLMALAPPAQPGVQAQTDAPQSEDDDGDIYLPLISTPPGPPDFTIISPADGLTVSGTSFFAVQALDPKSITSVSFQAGATNLGMDSTANDGFQVFMDASQLPAGSLQLAATATGPTGETVTKSITVTIVPVPPASATVGSSGTTLATASGNTIVVPPGAVSATATISIQDKTQEQVTEDEGIDWDSLGVTFLGAIDVQSTAPLAKPLGVSSVGFGNRVQPGQAVVTYRILPDADGDGVGELVVVNGANLAPNGTIVSSPVPDIVVNNISCSAAGGIGIEASANRSRSAMAQDNLQGPPGAMITIQGAGFNPLSVQGNVATFHSLVNGVTINIPATVEQNSLDVSDQTVRVLIPVLPPGVATLNVRNESTGSTAGPFNITVEEPIPLSQPASEIIDAFYAQSLDFVATLPADTDPQLAHRSTIIDQLTQLRAAFEVLRDDPSSEAQQLIHELATVIEGSGVLDSFQGMNVTTSSPLQACLTPNQKSFYAFLSSIFTIGGGLACALSFTGVTAPICAAAIALTFATLTFRMALMPNCPTPSPVCTPATTASGPGTTGMGAAPPPGGNGCGSAGGAAGDTLQSASLAQLEPDHFIVKIFPLAGGRLLTPFTGATDPGGYFFIPLIPQGEPFRALATDQLTGASVSVEGVGPPTGESTLMYFDFSNAQQNRYDIAIGDTITNGVPGPGAGNIEEPGGLDIYTFSATAGQQVFFDLVGGESALNQVDWQLLAPDGEVLFDRVLFCCGNGDPGVYTLQQAGTYTIKVGNDTDPGTGTYGFTLWDVPSPEQFAIAVGDTISNGVPGPGAGNIESPGAKDIYTFDATAGQQVFFDLVGGESALTQVDWQLLAPNGEVIFDRVLFCCGNGDPGVHTLQQAGTYTITVGDDTDNSTGTYGFTLWPVPAPDQFAIAVGDTISNGVPGPGAGNIESPGVKDIYTFNATAGQQVFFDLVGGESALTQVDWRLLAPDGEVIFDRVLFCCGNGDPGVHTLQQAGTYTITVGDDTDNSTGTYGFTLWPVPAPDQFAIAVGDTISNGVPGPGAGNIESPGVKDIYTFDATAGQQVFFDLVDGDSALTQVDWRLLAPDGEVIFDRVLFCCGNGDPGIFTLGQTGVYTITVGDDTDGSIGTYGFQIRTP
jgi:hypothetical protein